LENESIQKMLLYFNEEATNFIIEMVLAIK